MQSVRKTRMSNIELLRIIAMFMVVSLHYLDKGGFLEKLPCSLNESLNFPWILEAFCIAAVNVYVLISGYFMVNEDFKIRRIIKLWLQILFYSLCIPIVFWGIGVLPKEDLTIYKILHYIFPIYMEHYWFGTEFLMLLLISPILNMGVKNLTKKTLGIILSMFLIFTSVIPSILPVVLSYDDFGYNFLWFITLYLTSAYIRLHGISFFKKKGRMKALTLYMFSVIGIYIWMYFLNFIAYKTGHFSEKVTMSYHYNHILVWGAALGLFVFFLQLEIKGKFISRGINWIAQGTFGIYLLHEHLLLRYKWLDSVIGEKFCIGKYLCMVLGVMFIGIFIDYVRRKIFTFLEFAITKLKKGKQTYG